MLSTYVEPIGIQHENVQSSRNRKWEREQHATEPCHYFFTPIQGWQVRVSKKTVPMFRWTCGSTPGHIFMSSLEKVSIRGVTREFKIWQSHAANENLVGAYIGRRLKFRRSAIGHVIVLIDAITAHAQPAN